MAINFRAFCIYSFIVSGGLWLWAGISWAVPASYQAIENLKDSGQRQQPAVVEVPQVEYTSANLRDPFRPCPIESEEELNQTQLQPIPSSLPLLEIQGIVWGGEIPQAIVNNRVVNIGDTVAGVRIVDIAQEGITVFYEGHKRLITAPAANMISNQSLNSKGGSNEASY